MVCTYDDRKEQHCHVCNTHSAGDNNVTPASSSSSFVTCPPPTPKKLSKHIDREIDHGGVDGVDMEDDDSMLLKHIMNRFVDEDDAIQDVKMDVDDIVDGLLKLHDASIIENEFKSTPSLVKDGGKIVNKSLKDKEASIHMSTPLAEVKNMNRSFPFPLSSGKRKEYHHPMVTDADKALELLTESVLLLRSILTGIVLTNRGEILKEVSESTGVAIPILLYASRHGILKAHEIFFVDRDDASPNVEEKDCT